MEQWQKPLAFSEILDMAFRIVKEQFSKLFLIMLILIGPVDLLDLLSSIFNGTGFFKTSGAGSFTQLYNQFQSSQNNPDFFSGTTAGGNIVTVLTLIAGMILTPVAYASILILIDKLRRNQSLDMKMIIKQAFSRYWGLLGGSVVYILLMTLFSLIAIIGVVIVFVVSGMLLGNYFHPNAGLIISIVILSLLAMFGLLYPGIRWSFYFGAATFEKTAPGLGKSWRLTKKNYWRILGIFIVLMLVRLVISLVINATFSFLLGQSVLVLAISHLVAIVTDLILLVGYAIVFFDLRVRNEGEGLKQMIDEYHNDPDETPPANPQQ